MDLRGFIPGALTHGSFIVEALIPEALILRGIDP